MNASPRTRTRLSRGPASHGAVESTLRTEAHARLDGPEGALGQTRPTGLHLWAFATAAALALWTPALRAGAIHVPNGSFESPQTVFVETWPDSWQKTPKPFWYDESTGYSWQQLTGVFANTAAGQPDHIDNMHGSQGVFLFAVPQVGLFQDYTSIGGTNSLPDHGFAAKFQPGKSYTLQVGVIGGGGGMASGVTLQMGLYYLDANSNHVTVAATSIAYTPEVFPSTTHFVDFAVTVPAVKPDEAWAGKQIGIELVSTVDPTLVGGYWDIDQVRLSETIEIPNASFELPATEFVDSFPEFWQKPAKPFWYDETGGYLWTQLTGAFANTTPDKPDHIDNIHGKQAIFLFAVPEVGLFQDYDSVGGTNSAPEHAFHAVFEVGKAYNLKLGLIGGGGGMIDGASLQIGLYYRDAAGNRVMVAATNVIYSPAGFPATTHFVDVAVQSGIVRPADPWAGKHIGVDLLSTVAPTLVGGYWDVDNLRIDELPGTALLSPAWTAAGFGFVLRSAVGLKFEVLASDDVSLPASAWTSLGVVTNVSGTVSVSYPAAGLGSRYYRARQAP